jgi:methyl-accepting chemotaxis protein
VQEIAAASQEQSQSVTQIGGAMGQLSKATQQNASASEELAATAEELSGQAAQLQDSVAFFKLGVDDRAPAMKRAAASKRYAEPSSPDAPPHAALKDQGAARQGPGGARIVAGNFRPY